MPKSNGGDSPRILHVTESMGGGTASALIEFVRSSPEYEHHIAYLSRSGSEIDADLAALFASSYESIHGLIGLRLCMRRAMREIQPGLIHLHSSWAGLIGRLGVRRMRKSASLLYSPHCFYFERLDVGPLRRQFVRIVERLLAARTDAVVCVSPHEAELAGALGAQTYLVPNTTRASAVAFPGLEDGFRDVVTIGRICEQKDPAFLREVATLVRTSIPDTKWTWIGGGDPGQEQALREAGVEVTGWIPQDNIAQRLNGASVYVHTARWESCPMSLLEAAAANVPIVARSIPALVSIGLAHGIETPQQMADALIDVIRSDTARSSVIKGQSEFRRRHSNAAQVDALAETYRECRSLRWSPGEPR